MPTTEEELREIQEELKWVTIREKKNSFKNKSTAMKVMDILVPAGCLATAGVLGTGVYFLYKKNSAKQQQLMRYRVLAQGATLALASFAILQYKLTKNP